MSRCRRCLTFALASSVMHFAGAFRSEATRLDSESKGDVSMLEEQNSYAEKAQGWCERKYEYMSPGISKSATSKKAKEVGLQPCTCETCFANGLPNKRNYIAAPCCGLAKPMKKKSGKGAKNITSCVTWLDTFNTTDLLGYGYCDFNLEVKKIQRAVTLEHRRRVTNNFERFGDLRRWREFFEPDQVSKEDKLKKDAEKKEAKAKAELDRVKSQKELEELKKKREAERKKMEERKKRNRWMRDKLIDKFAKKAIHSLSVQSMESIYTLLHMGEKECRSREYSSTSSTPLLIGAGKLADILNAAGGLALTYRFNLTKPSKSKHLWELRTLAVQSLVSYIIGFLQETRDAPDSMLQRLYEGTERAQEIALQMRTAGKLVKMTTSGNGLDTSHLSKARQIIVNTMELFTAEMTTRAVALVNSTLNSTVGKVMDIAPSQGVDKLRIQSMKGFLDRGDLGRQLGEIFSTYMQSMVDSLQLQSIDAFSLVVEQVEAWKDEVQKSGTILEGTGKTLKKYAKVAERYVEWLDEIPLGSEKQKEWLVETLLYKLDEYFTKLQIGIKDVLEDGIGYLKLLLDKVGDATVYAVPDDDAELSEHAEHSESEGTDMSLLDALVSDQSSDAEA